MFKHIRLKVQLGEELLAQGDVENGVEHLSLAVAVCGQPHSLLGVLQQTLPPQIYKLLLQNLDLAQDRVRSHVSSSVPGLMRGGPDGPSSMGSAAAAAASPAAAAPGPMPGPSSSSAPGSGPSTMNEDDVE